MGAEKNSGRNSFGPTQPLKSKTDDTQTDPLIELAFTEVFGLFSAFTKGGNDEAVRQ